MLFSNLASGLHFPVFETLEIAHVPAAEASGDSCRDPLNPGDRFTAAFNGTVTTDTSLGGECVDGMNNDIDTGIDGAGLSVTNAMFKAQCATAHGNNQWMATLKCRNAAGTVTTLARNNVVAVRDLYRNKALRLGWPVSPWPMHNDQTTANFICQINGYQSAVLQTGEECEDPNYDDRCKFKNGGNDTMVRITGTVRTNTNPDPECVNGSRDEGPTGNVCPEGNLIINGDFEQGFNGRFDETGYAKQFGCSGRYTPDEGQILITTNPRACHNFYGSESSGGRMLVANTAPSQRNIWCQNDFDVLPNSLYQIRADVRGAVDPDRFPGNIPGVDAVFNRIKWTVNGQDISGAVQTPRRFENMVYTWNSGNSRKASLCVRNVDTDAITLDTVIDNIRFEQIEGGTNGNNGCNERPECSNDIDDDDGDTLADENDPGCFRNPNDPNTYDPNDDDESNPPGRPACRNVDTSFTGGRPTLRWSNVAGATAYEVRVFQGTNIVFQNLNVAGTVNGNDRTFQVTQNLPAGNYRFEVSAKNLDGTGEACGGINFDVRQCQDGQDNADPEDTLADANDPGCFNGDTYNPRDNDETHTPVPGVPQCNAVNVDFTAGRPTVTWGAVNGATSYDVEVFEGNTRRESRNVTGTSFQIARRDNGTYTFRVRAKNAGGNSAFCGPVTFDIKQCQDGRDNADTEDSLADAQDPGCINGGVYTPRDDDESNLPPPGTPQCNNVDANFDAGRPTFSWNAVNTATSYEVEVRNGTQVVATATTANTNVRINTRLDKGNYNFRVRALNATGPGNYCGQKNFDVRECQDGIDNADPEDTLADANDPGCLNGTTYNPRDNDETHTPLPSVPQCNAVDVDFTAGRPTVSWGAAAGATSYDVEVYEGNTLRESRNVTGTSFQIARRDNGTYSFRVRSKNSAGTSNFCTARVFDIKECQDGRDNADPEDTLADAQDPGCINNGTYNPRDDDETHVVIPGVPQCNVVDLSFTAGRPTVTWNAVNGATSYDVEIFRGNQKVVSSNVTGTSFIPNRLASGDYSFKVRSKNSAGTSNFCGARTFDIRECQDGVDSPADQDHLVDSNDPGCINNGTYDPRDDDERNPPNVPVCRAVDTGFTDGKPTVRWSNVPGATAYEVRLFQGNQVVFNRTNVQGTLSGNDRTFQISTRLDKGDYRLEVIAKNSDGATNACAGVTFDVRECQDGVDNADPEDNLRDEQDPGCRPNGTYDPRDNSEVLGPDFTLTKAANKTNVLPEEEVIYTISITNHSAFNVSRVTVVDTLPANTTYLGANNQGQHLTVFKDVDLISTGNLNENWGGRGEKWIFDQDNDEWYFIIPNGDLFKWNGSPRTNLTGDLIARFDDSYHTDINKLTQLTQRDDELIIWIPSLNQGQTKSLNLRVKINAGTPAGTRITNRVTAGVDSAENTQVVVGQPLTSRLTIEKSIDDTTADAGGQVTYSFRITNTGDATATGLEIEDFFVQGGGRVNPPLTFDRAIGANCTYQQGTQSFRCTGITSLGPNSTNTIRMVFNVPETGLCNQVINNRASVSSSNTNVTASTEDSASTTVNCPQPTFTVTKTDGVTVVEPGQRLTYVITVTNTSNVPATDIEIRDIFPGSVEFDAHSHGNTTIGEGHWIVPNLLPGASVTRDLRVIVKDNVTNGQRIDNLVKVFDNNLPVAEFTDTDTVQIETNNLRVRKVANESTVNHGDTIRFVVSVWKEAGKPARNVVIRDTFPNGITYLDNGSSTTCNLATNGTNTAVCDLGDLDQARNDFNIVILVDTDNLHCPAGTTVQLPNEAIITTDTPSTTGVTRYTATLENPVNIVCPAVPQFPDVEISKARATGTQPTGRVAFTLTATNTGDAPAQNVVIKDLVPQKFDFHSGNDCSFHAASNEVRCNLGTLGAGDTVTRTIVFEIESSADCPSTVSNTATIETTSQESDTTNNTSNTVTSPVVCPAATYTVSKTDNQTTVQRGQQLTYTITARNTNNVPATNVEIRDILPGNVDFVSQTGNGANGNGRWIIANFAANATETRTITVRVKDSVSNGDQVVNRVEVKRGGAVLAQDTDTNNVSVPNPTYSVTKTDNKTVVLRGEELTYTITARNTNNVAATNVEIRDILPTNADFVSQSNEGNTQTGNGRWVIPNFAANAVHTRTLTVRVKNTVTNGQQVRNIVRVLQGGTQKAENDDVNTVNVPPLSADLDIVKTGRDRIPRTETLVYMIQVLNRGPDPATNVRVVDELPFGLTPVNLPAECTFIAGNPATGVKNRVQCDRPGQLDFQRQWPLTLSFTIDDDVACGATLSNVASTTSDTPDPVQTNNNTNANPVNTFIECPNGNVIITKSGPATAMPGDRIVYDIVATNTTNNTIFNSLIFDQPPAHTQFLPDESVPGGCFIGIGFTDVFCPAQDIGPRGIREQRLVFKVNDNAPCGQGVNISNIADIWADNADATWSNEVITNIVCPVVDPTYTVTKDDGKTVVERDEELTYTITVRNANNSAGTNIEVVDTIPANTTFVRQSNNGGVQTGNGRWLYPNIPAGGSVTQTITVRVNNTVNNGDQIRNEVDVKRGGAVLAEDSDVDTARVLTSNLDIIKTVGATVTAGNEVTYTFDVTNNGTATATNVRVFDYFTTGPNTNTRIDPPFTFERSTGGTCTYDATQQYFICSIGDMGPNTSKRLTMTFSTVAGTLCDQVVANKVDVHAANNNQVGSDWAAAQTTVRCPVATYTVTKDDGKTVVERNEELTYTITVRNTNSTAGTNIEVVDTIPANTTFVRQSNNGGVQTGNGRWLYPNIPAGGTVSQTITVRVNSTVNDGDQIRNEVDVKRGGTVLAEDSDVDTARVQAPTYTVTKDDGKTIVSRGEELTYTITASNTNNTAGSNLEIEDTIPTNTTFVRQSNNGGAQVGQGRWVYANIPAGGSVTQTITVRVNSTVNDGDQVRNSVRLKLNGTQVASDVDTDTVRVIDPTYTVTKDDGKTVVVRGEQLTYTLTARNTNNAAGTNITLQDTIPANTTFVSQSNNGGTQVGQGRWVYPNIPAGGTVSQTITVQVNSTVNDGDQVTNLVQLLRNGVQVAQDTDVDTVRVQAPTYTVTKDDGKTIVERGETLTYTLTARNTNNVAGTNVTLEDTIPTNTTFVSQSDNGGTAVGQGRWIFSNIPAGGTVTQTITVRVNNTVNDGDQVRNQVQVKQGTAVLATDTDVDTVRVQAPTYSVTKDDGKVTVGRNEELTYTITARNTNNVAGTNISLEDTTPVNTTFVSQSNNGGTQVGQGRWLYANIPAGGTVTQTITVRVNSTVNDGDQVRNQVDVKQGGTVLATDTDVDTVRVIDPTYTVTKDDGKTVVERGETLTYTITARNTNNAAGTNITLEDTIPTNTTFVSQSNNGGTQVGQGRWLYANIPAGGTVTQTITVRVNNTVNDGDQVRNQVDVKQGATVLATDTDVDTVRVQTPTYTVAKDDGKTIVSRGEELTYTLTATNTNNVEGTNIELRDTLPLNTTFVSQSDNGGTAVGQGRWIFPAIPAGGSVTQTITVRVNSNVNNGDLVTNLVQLLRNSVQVAQDTDTDTVRVPDPTYTVSKDDGKTVVTRDEVLTYTIIATNTNNVAGTNIELVETFPVNTTFVSQSNNGGTQVGQGRWLYPTIPAGGTVTQTVTVRVNSNAINGDQVRNQIDVRRNGNVLATDTDIDTINVVDPTYTVSKDDGKLLVQRGEELTYTLTATNTNNTAGTNVLLQDTIPANTTFVSQSDNGATAIGQGRWLYPNIPAGGSVTQTITVRVNNNVSHGEQVNNLVEVLRSNTQLAQARDIDTVDVPVVDADLSVIKTGTSQVLKGGRISYQLTVSNAGPATANNVMLTDPAPKVLNDQGAQVMLVYDNAASDPLCNLVGTNVECNGFPLVSGASRTFNLVFVVPNVAQCDALISNHASVNSNSPDPNPVNNKSNTVTTRVFCPVVDTDLEIAKTARDRIPNTETLVYTFTVKNNGPADATGVKVIDFIPAGLVLNTDPTLTDPSCVPGAGNTVECNRALLAAGDTWTFTMAFDLTSAVQCNSVIQNTARVQSATNDPDLSNNFISPPVNTFVECPVNKVDIQKSGPATVNLGDTITYTIVATNTGTSVAKNVVIFDQVPANTTFVPGPPSSPECILAPAGTDVFCAPQDLAPGATRTVTLVFQVSSNPAICGTSIANIADVWVDNSDPDWSNQVNTTVLCPQPGVGISKTDNQVTTSPGELLTYQISLTNTGTVAATGLEVVDTLPTGTTFVSASDGGSNNAGTVTWTGITVPPTSTKTLTVVALVSQTATNGQVLTNNAQITGGPSAQDITTVSVLQPTFTIEKTDGLTTATPGQQLTYSITVTNTTGQAVSGIEVVDTLPSVLTFVSASTGGIATAQTVTWSNLSFAVNETKVLTVTAQVPQTIVNGTVLLNQAQVTGGPSATDLTTVLGPSLTLSKDDGRTTAQAGETLIYTIKVNNVSTVDASNVVVTDVLPTGVTFVTADNNGSHNGGTVTWTVPSIPAGQTATLMVTVTIDSTTAPQTALLNVVSLPGGITAQDLTTVTGQAELSIEKTDNRTTVAPNEIVVYNITLSNSTAVVGSNVQVTDVLPAGVSYISSSNGGTHTGGTVTWNNLTVPANGTLVLSLVGRVAANLTGGTILTNTATITGGPSAQDSTTVVVINTFGCIEVVKEALDLNNQLITPVPQFTFLLDGGTQTASNNSTGVARFDNVPTGTHTVSEQIPSGWNMFNVTPNGGLVSVSAGSNCSTVLFKNKQILPTQSNVGITKTDGLTTATPGQTLTYQITLNNTGTATATGIQVTDTLPAGVTLISANPAAVQSGQTLVFNNLTVPVGGSNTIVVNALIGSTVANGTVLTNTATITGGPSATDTTTVSVQQQANYTITKTDNRTTAAAGETLNYVITVTNTSTTAGTVTVTDTLPSSLIIQNATGASIVGQQITWNNVAIPAGQSRVLTVSALINSTTPANTVITNTATVQGGPSATDTTSVTGGVQPTPLTIAKTDNRTTAMVGDTLNYVITITNTNSAPVTGVTVTDALPAGVTFVGASGGGTHSAGVVTWSNLMIPVGTLTLTVNATVNIGTQNGTVLTNTAQIQGGLSAVDTTSVTATGQGNPSIDITDDRDPVEIEDTFCYSIRVSNPNSTALTNQTVTQTLDGNTEYQSSSDAGSHSSRIVTWRNITIPANGTKNLNSCVRVDDDAEDGDILNSRAFIGSASATETTRVEDDDDRRRDDDECRIVSITDTPDPVDVDGTLSYTIRIRNDSNRSRQVDLYAFLDGDLRVVDVSNGGDENGREVEWENIRLSRNETETFRVTTRVLNNIRPGDTLRIRARCEDDEQTEITRVEGRFVPPGEPPRPEEPAGFLSVDKRASKSTAKPGDVVTYTISVRNNSTSAVRNVSVQDRFTAGSVSIISDGGGSTAGSGLDWIIPVLNPGDSRNFSYSVRAVGMSHGDIITNTVKASSPDTEREVTDTVEVRIIDRLPQTGLGGFFSSFSDTNSNLTPSTVSAPGAANTSTTTLFITLTSLISAGAAVGGFLGKRLFFY